MGKGGHMQVHQHFEPIKERIDTIPHIGTPGTWFGLPDFGITEALFGGSGGTKLNNPLITNPTSTPNGSYTAPASTNGGGSWGGTGSTLGVTNQNPVSNPNPAPVNNNPNPTPPGGGGGASQDPLISGANAYISQLNDMLSNGLPSEAAGQNQTAQSSYDLGASTAATNKSSAETTVNTATAKNLKDLGSNMQNLFQGGNVYLGARGAGDSSAANQYAFALTQMGSKQRASILSDATTRLGQIGDIYTNQMATLKSGLDTQLGNISSWLYNAQNTIKGQIGSIGYQSAQQQSQQAYNMAMTAAQNAQASLTSNRQALQTWAENNSTSTQALIKNLQAVEQTPQWGGLNGTPQVSGGSTTPSLFGAAGSTQKYDQYGNPIS